MCIGLEESAEVLIRCEGVGELNVRVRGGPVLCIRAHKKRGLIGGGIGQAGVT
jgi:hypothetical protein